MPNQNPNPGQQNQNPSQNALVSNSRVAGRSPASSSRIRTVRVRTRNAS